MKNKKSVLIRNYHSSECSDEARGIAGNDYGLWSVSMALKAIVAGSPIGTASNKASSRYRKARRDFL